MKDSGRDIREILVPTDFSKFADDAFDAALMIAEKLGAQVHLYHCITLPDIVVDQPTESKQVEQFRKAIVEWTTVKMKEYGARAKKKHVECVIEHGFGNFLDELEMRTGRHNIDLVIMGSQGASGKKEWFIGSNTQKALRKLKIPVLVIKNPLPSVDFKKAVFVGGLDLNERDTFKEYLSFLSNFEVEELHIMSVNTSSFFTQPGILMEQSLAQFERLAGDFNTKTHFYADISIDAGVRHFIEEHKINIVGISNHHKHPFRRMLQGSNVEMIANHSEIPVLAISDRQ